MQAAWYQDDFQRWKRGEGAIVVMDDQCCAQACVKIGAAVGGILRLGQRRRVESQDDIYQAEETIEPTVPSSSRRVVAPRGGGRNGDRAGQKRHAFGSSEKRRSIPRRQKADPPSSIEERGSCCRDCLREN